MPDVLGEIGTLAWTRRTGGRLTASERARFVAAAMAEQARSAPRIVGLRAGVRGGRRIALADADLAAPDSVIAREAHEAACDLMSESVVAHSVRSFLYARALARVDGLAPDEEILFVAAMLHDAGAHEVDLRDGGRCFTLAGAERAEALLGRTGFPREACEAAAEAITLHVNPSVSPAQGTEAHLVHDGVLLDAVGLRAWQVATESIEAVRARHPRHGFTQEGTRLLREQARAIPNCRAAAAFSVGFGLALRLGPWQD